MFVELVRRTRHALLNRRSYLIMLLLILAACQPPKPVHDLSPPGGGGMASVIVTVADRYGIDSNANGVVDMPNTVAYVQAPLQVTVNASRLARTYPSNWPYADLTSAGFDSTEGPWRWTFTSSQAQSVPAGHSFLAPATIRVGGLCRYKRRRAAGGLFSCSYPYLTTF